MLFYYLLVITVFLYLMQAGDFGIRIITLGIFHVKWLIDKFGINIH